MKTKFRILVLAGFTAAAASSCAPHTAGRAWYDVYGHLCTGPKPGCNFYDNGGVLDKINLQQDPYYDDYYTGMQWDIWSYHDSFGNPRTYVGFAWESPNGIIYDSFGSALNSAGESEVSPDVIADVAAAEAVTVAEAGHIFAERHALAETAGQRIAATLNTWAKIGENRSRTEGDLDYISKQILGFNLNQMKKAWNKYQAGDSADLSKMNVDVAKYWGTTPETSREILQKWAGQSL